MNYFFLVGKSVTPFDSFRTTFHTMSIPSPKRQKANEDEEANEHEYSMSQKVYVVCDEPVTFWPVGNKYGDLIYRITCKKDKELRKYYSIKSPCEYDAIICTYKDVVDFNDNPVTSLINSVVDEAIIPKNEEDFLKWTKEDYPGVHPW